MLKLLLSFELVIVITLALALLFIGVFMNRAGDVESPSIGDVISGRVYVNDGDGMLIGSHKVRLYGIDAPEFGQSATLWNGTQIDYGSYVKSQLIKRIGGKQVEVLLHARDKYDRWVGVVYADGVDINAWLVREGFAIAAYGDDYRGQQAEAKRERRGQWRMKAIEDPRKWRAKHPRH